MAKELATHQSPAELVAVAESSLAAWEHQVISELASIDLRCLLPCWGGDGGNCNQAIVPGDVGAGGVVGTELCSSVWRCNQGEIPQWGAALSWGFPQVLLPTPPSLLLLNISSWSGLLASAQIPQFTTR